MERGCAAAGPGVAGQWGDRPVHYTQPWWQGPVGPAGFVPGDPPPWDVGSLAQVVALWTAAATSFERPPVPARALNLGLALPLQEHHPPNLTFEGHQ